VTELKKRVSRSNKLIKEDIRRRVRHLTRCTKEDTGERKGNRSGTNTEVEGKQGKEERERWEDDEKTKTLGRSTAK
jgi:hypothetical protein